MNSKSSTFPTTHWSLIASAQDDPAALAQLLEAYWRPIYGFLRARGLSAEDAADQTQAFISDVVLHRDLIGRADATKGSFRPYLKTALRRFHVDMGRRQQARQPDGEARVVPLNEADRALADPRPNEDPLHAFDRLWAETVMNGAIQELQTYLLENQFQQHWAVFEMRVLAPLATGNAPPSMGDVAEALKLENAETASRLLYSVKRRFRSTLENVVAKTLTNATEAELELDHLLHLLRPGA